MRSGHTPGVAVPRARHLPSALAAFQHKGFGWLWASGFGAHAAWMLEIFTQGWLVLELTNSPLWVGVAAGIRGVGATLASVAGGVLADRWDRRRLLIAFQVVSALLALVLGLLVLFHMVLLWHVLAVVFLLGGVQAVVAPARNAITFDMVGSRALLNAIAANYLTSGLSRILLPAIGGILIATAGIGYTYLLVAVCWCAAAGFLLALRSPPSPSGPRPSFLANLGEGLRFASQPGPVRSLLIASVITEYFGFAYQHMLPVMARDVLKVGSTGYGALASAVGVGSLTGALLVATRGDAMGRARVQLVATIGFGALLLAFAFSPWFPLSMVLVAITGMMASAYDTTMNTLLQVTSPDQYRGRVMGLYAMTWLGTFGGMQAGAIASVIGAPIAVGIGGAAVVINGLRVAPFLRRLV
ncbi:MAG: MFS transporter [Chloroflexi bacterium]|nr:MFS transporter [Chloroflexota bacterium]